MIPHSCAYQRMATDPLPSAFLRCLDEQEKFSAHVELRELSYRALPVGAGVDVGCGHGLAVAELTKRGIPAIGVDREVMVEAARQRFPNCDYRVAEATELPFSDGVMRWYRAARVYLHLRDPLGGLIEARRILAPGGRIVTVDPDLDTIALTSTDPYATRKLLDAFIDDLPSGRIGSRLPGLLAEAGFTDVTSSAYPVVHTDLERIRAVIPEQAAQVGLEAGLVTAAQAQAWLNDLQEHGISKRFMCAYTAFVNVASVPIA